MLRILLLVAVIALVIVVSRVVVLRCGRNPALRRWFIAGGIGGLCLAALLVPWLLAKLEPPWSESPAGIFVYLGKFLVIAFLVVIAVGTLLGAALSARKRNADHAGPGTQKSDRDRIAN